MNNMPDEVRGTIIRSLIEVSCDVHCSAEETARIDAALAWLDAQPAAPEPEPRWEPVEEMPCTPCGCGVCGRFIEYRNGALYIEDDGELLSAELPAGYALCRRVEGTP